MIYKTTVTWKPSPDVEAAILSGDPGKAGYKARFVFDNGEKGVEQRPEVILPPTQCSLSIEAPEGQRVVVLVAALSPAGVMSPATPFEFICGANIPPMRPTEVRVGNVEAIAVAAKVIGTTATAAPAEDSYRLSIDKLDGVPDGAVGVITGLSGIAAKADSIELKVDFDGVEKVLTADDIISSGAKVIAPDQSIISVSDYLAVIT